MKVRTSLAAVSIPMAFAIALGGGLAAQADSRVTEGVARLSNVRVVDMDADSLGDVYIANATYDTPSIVRVSSTGVVQDNFVAIDPTTLPEHVSVLPDGTVIATTSPKHTAPTDWENVVRKRPDGTITVTALPVGVSVVDLVSDSLGNAYLLTKTRTDVGEVSRIAQVTPTGTLRMTFGNLGMLDVNEAVVDSKDNIFVRAGEKTIVRVSPTGVLTHLANTDAIPGHVRGINVDRDGNVLATTASKLVTIPTNSSAISMKDIPVYYELNGDIEVNNEGTIFLGGHYGWVHVITTTGEIGSMSIPGYRMVRTDTNEITTVANDDSALNRVVLTDLHPEISYPTDVYGVVGTAMSTDPKGFALSGTFAVSSGSLPPGLTLDAATGRIYGKPTASGPFSVKISVTTSKGSVELPLNVVIRRLSY